MKYITEIEINKPIDRVIELFDDSDNLGKWLDGLQSFEHLSGTPGQPGATSRLKFKMGKREIEMVETILVRNLPDKFSGTYEAKGVYNKVDNQFIKLDENKTKYITNHDFQFKGIMKIFAFLMPGSFKKQSIKNLKAFKNFVETQD